MKWIGLILFSLLLHQVSAQKFTGLVKDVTTQLPVANVQVYSFNSSTNTDENGRFVIEKLSKGDNFSLRLMGYKTVELIFGGTVRDTVIYLNPTSLTLNEVKIETKRNYKLDSINLRKEYARVFNAKPIKVSDMFIKKDPNYRSPFPGTNPTSTASILNINVLQLASLLTQKKDPIHKFRSTLLKAEADRYVDHVFSKEKVSQLTGLKGDSLTIFINKYRPEANVLKKMSAYELTL